MGMSWLSCICHNWNHPEYHKSTVSSTNCPRDIDSQASKDACNGHDCHYSSSKSHPCNCHYCRDCNCKPTACDCRGLNYHVEYRDCSWPCSCSGSYNTFELDEESWELFVIITHFGKLKYKCLPMGLNTASNFVQQI